MINLFKTGILSVALLASAAANASKIITVSSPGAKVVNITLAEIAEGEILSILDTDGSKLLEEKLTEADSFTKTINFSPLEEGFYFLETKKEGEINVTPIVIKAEEVNILSKLTKTYTAPTITTDGTLARILVKNFDKSQVNVTIYDSKSGEEYKLEDSKDLLVYRSFDFEKLGAGTYTIAVSQAGYYFTKEITF